MITPLTGNYKDGTSSTFGSPNIWNQGAFVQDFSELRANVCIPEPAGILVLALGGLAIFSRRRRS